VSSMGISQDFIGRALYRRNAAVHDICSCRRARTFPEAQVPVAQA